MLTKNTYFHPIVHTLTIWRLYFIVFRTARENSLVWCFHVRDFFSTRPILTPFQIFKLSYMVNLWEKELRKKSTFIFEKCPGFLGPNLRPSPCSYRQKKEKQETLSQLFLVNSRSDVQVDPRLLTRVCSKLTDKGELLIQTLTQVRDKRLRILLPVN